MGKMEKNQIENQATKVTKIPRTKRRTYGMNKTFVYTFKYSMQYILNKQFPYALCTTEKDQVGNVRSLVRSHGHQDDTFIKPSQYTVGEILILFFRFFFQFGSLFIKSRLHIPYFSVQKKIMLLTVWIRRMQQWNYEICNQITG